MTMNRNEIHYEITDFRTEEMKKKEKQFFKEISKLYKKAYTDLREIIYKFFEKYADNENKLHQAELFKHKRDQKLKKEIATIISNLSKEELKLLNDEIKSVINEEGTYALYLLAMLGVNAKPLTEKQKKEILENRWVAETYKETHKKNKSILADAIYSSIVAGTLGGATIKQLLKQTKTKLESGAKKEMLLFQTEGHRKKNEAYQYVFTNKGGYEEKYIWTITYDERTCSTCVARENRRYNLNEVDYPAHPRCRCVLLPDLSSFGHKESKLRSARDIYTNQSYLTDKKRYSEWKKEQGL